MRDNLPHSGTAQVMPAVKSWHREKYFWVAHVIIYCFKVRAFKIYNTRIEISSVTKLFLSTHKKSDFYAGLLPSLCFLWKPEKAGIACWRQGNTLGAIQLHIWCGWKCSCHHKVHFKIAKQSPAVFFNTAGLYAFVWWVVKDSNLRPPP